MESQRERTAIMTVTKHNNNHNRAPALGQRCAEHEEWYYKIMFIITFLFILISLNILIYLYSLCESTENAKFSNNWVIASPLHKS